MAEAMAAKQPVGRYAPASLIAHELTALACWCLDIQGADPCPARLLTRLRRASGAPSATGHCAKAGGLPWGPPVPDPGAGCWRGPLPLGAMAGGGCWAVQSLYPQLTRPLGRGSPAFCCRASWLIVRRPQPIPCAGLAPGNGSGTMAHQPLGASRPVRREGWRPGHPRGRHAGRACCSAWWLEPSLLCVTEAVHPVGPSWCSFSAAGDGSFSAPLPGRYPC